MNKLRDSCGGNSEVEFQLPKLATRVRFPSPAPLFLRGCSLKRLLFVIAAVIPFFLTGCAAVYYPDPTPALVRQGKGVHHIVERGQTLWRIAQVYGVDMDQIIWVNHITDSSSMKQGERIFIPGVAKVLKVDAQREDLHADEFAWPVRGKILDYFHGHDAEFWKKGVRIKAASGEKVSASRRGKVVFSDDLMGYGPTVILDHQDGFMSVYANNGQVAVDLGEEVKKGNTVANAQVGENGFLYFEIRRKGEAVNPSFYLPKI